MASLGLPDGFEAFHDVKDDDELDDMSMGEMSLVPLGSPLDNRHLDDHLQNVDSDHHNADVSDHGINDGIGLGDDHGDSTVDNGNEEGHENLENDHNDQHEGNNDDEYDDSQPHLISADSMATVKHENINQAQVRKPFLSNQTPYASLKDLVKSKKRQLNGRSGTMENMGSGGGGMVSRPSTFLRQALYGSRPVPQPNQEFQQPDKRIKVDEPEIANPLLHKACMKHGVEAEVIEAMLKIDKNLAGKAHQIVQNNEVYDCTSYKFKQSKTKEKYCYPLNIAIRHRVKAAAVELLVRAAPHVAAFTDGNLKECSLSILLKNNPHDSELADLLLLSNPVCVKVRDKNGNTPLHMACQYGASLATVKHICILYPQALQVKNRFGHTPLEVAQRANRSNLIATYLYGKQRGIF